MMYGDGVFLFSEPVFVTYLDLDTLIECSGLSRSERYVVDRLMYGYQQAEIARHTGKSKHMIQTLLSHAVDKIV